jgi:hypothetical protein
MAHVVEKYCTAADEHDKVKKLCENLTGGIPQKFQCITDYYSFSSIFRKTTVHD